METVYAQALAKMIASGRGPKEAVEALRHLLVRRGRAALLPKIGRAFARIAQRERSRNDVVLTTARTVDQRAAESEVGSLLASMKVNPKDLLFKTDESLIGGWRMEGRERLVDASFKKQLLSLYNRVTQS